MGLQTQGFHIVFNKNIRTLTKSQCSIQYLHIESVLGGSTTYLKKCFVLSTHFNAYQSIIVPLTQFSMKFLQSLHTKMKTIQVPQIHK